MKRTSTGQHERGGAVVWFVVAALVASAGYFGYRLLVFYRENVAPTVAEVSKVAGAVKAAWPSYKLTRDPDEVARTLQSSFRIAPPDGYRGAFGFTFEALGKERSQVVALSPDGVPASEIFEGGAGEIRFNPGSHTIFLAIRSDRTDRDAMRETIARMTSGDGQLALQPVQIDAGGKRVAAYVGTAENYGRRNKLVFVFLDDGRLFHAVGPSSSFDDAALGRVLTALVAAHPANQLLYEHPKIEATAPSRVDPCGIPGVAGDFDVVVVSVSRGTTPLDVALDKSGREVAREEVVVGVTPKPVVLVLTGNDPIVWNVGRTPGARIAGILAEGAYRQAVIGVPKTTPMSSYSSSDGPNACPYFRAERTKGSEYGAVETRVRELFGRGISTYIDRKASGRFLIGDAAGEASYSPDITLASVALPDTVLPGGKRGIDRLVKQKTIRPATDEDIAAWVKGAAQRLGQPVDGYRSRMAWRLYKDSVYVVLEAFELPDGLAGANARTFILPPGAARPAGPQGHNTFLTMDGFQCYGVGCS
jgi:hypothetical protein